MRRNVINVMAGMVVVVAFALAGCGGGGSSSGSPTPTPVANAAPVANAGTTRSVRVGRIVTLDGSKSSDANNDILSYNWVFSSKPSGSNAILSNFQTAKPEFTPDMSGDYVIKLTINDGKVDANQSVIPFLNQE